MTHVVVPQSNAEHQASHPGRGSLGSSIWLPKHGILHEPGARANTRGRMCPPQEAYSALLANPVDERKAEALRELLRELCRRGRIAALLALPLADTVDVRLAGRCNEVLCSYPVPAMAASPCFPCVTYCV